MQQVTAVADRARTADLFCSVPYWRAFIESAIEREIGVLSVDDVAEPNVAVLFYGGLVVYAGDPGSPAAEDAIRVHDVQPLVLLSDDAWASTFRRLRTSRFAEAVRYNLPSDSLSSRDLRNVLNETAAHAERVRPITRAALTEIEETLGWEHHRYHFSDQNHFLSGGHGFCLREDDAVVSAASSFAISRHYSECQVTTADAHRKRGYARAVAARYLHDCREHDLMTPWDASNEASVRLARSLGFQRVEEYTVLEQVWS